MFGFKKLRKKNQVREAKPTSCPPVQEDSITLSLPMLDISLTRKLNTDVPHEVSIIVPRAEIRYNDGSAEWIYSSITVVHAPRHPLAGEQPPGGGKAAEVLPSSLGPVPADTPAETIIKPPVGAAGELSVTPVRNNEPSYKITYKKKP